MCSDQDETREVQEKRIEDFRKKGDRHFAEDGRGAEITVEPQKHWEWQEERTPMLRHGSVVRSTMYLASMDTKTAFDETEACSKNYGISALLREMSGSE